MKIRLSKKEDLLRVFIRGAQENDSYSVPELCRKVGIPYEQIQRWARNDLQWEDALEIATSRCMDNAEMAAMMKRMPLKQALKYMGNANRI